MIFVVLIIGGFLGRLLIGSILNFIFKPNEHNNPNPENWLGWVGSIVGAIIAAFIYKN